MARENPGQFPEHEKLTKVSNQSQAIGEFVEWMLNVKGYHIAEYREDEYRETVMWDVGRPITDLLAEFYGIDLEVLEDEKLQMLEQQRELNEATQ